MHHQNMTPPDLAQFQATMQAIELACNSIQRHANPAAAEATILSHQPVSVSVPGMPVHSSYENSRLANARFQAAGAIRDAAIREQGFLEADDRRGLISKIQKRLLQLYASHNIGKVSVSLSNSLRTEADAEKYKDLRAILQLLLHLCSKDLVVYMGLHIVTPLISLDLLKYPKLCHSYFSLLSHMLEVYPEMIAQLNTETFTHILGTLDFGLHHQDIEVVDLCLRALRALASHHYKDRGAGKVGLGSHATGYKDPGGKFHEGILSRFLRSLLQLLLFEDYSTDLVSSAADALFPLILCEQSFYQSLANELIERQLNQNAFHPG